MQALILAGSRGGRDPVADYAGVTDKALIEVGGRTMLARVAAAVREAGIERILVSASSEPVRRHAGELGVEVIASQAGPSASALSAFTATGAPLLITTADHALLRPEWITAFLAAPGNADVRVLLARQESIERDAPPTQRTYLRFADAHWSGCNMFLLATPAAGAALELWQDIERDRKRPWRIVRRLGWLQLLRYATGQLRLSDALSDIGARIGITVAVVEAASGLAAVDVDKPADLDLVRGLIG